MRKEVAYLVGEMQVAKDCIVFLNGKLKSIASVYKVITPLFTKIKESENINASCNEVVLNLNDILDERKKHLSSILNNEGIIKISEENKRVLDLEATSLEKELPTIQEKSNGYAINIKIYSEEKELLNYVEVQGSREDTLLQVKQIYNGIVDDSKGKLRDLEMVNQNISKAKASMDTMAKEIQIFGFNLSFFESKYCERHSENELSNLAEKIKAASIEFERQENIFNEKDKDVSGVEAVIKNLIKTLENDNKIKYAELEVPNFDIEEELQKKDNLKESKEDEIDITKDEIEKIDINIRDVQREIESLNIKMKAHNSKIVALSSTKNDIDNLITNEGIDRNITRDMSDDIEYITLRAKGDLNSNKRKIENVQNKHKNRVDITKITLNSSTFNFAEDLNDVYTPINLEACLSQIEDITGEYGYLYLLQEEKSCLVGEMEELESYQESFGSLCIQRCNYALDKLLDIEEFSKIDINGEKISAIKVVLNVLPDDERKIKMRNYITNIVNSIELTEMNETRIKEFGRLLELKNLFPQILKDVNKSIIKIYKINDTCDGGKYIEWGQAGSTGQTNSMFLYFFMCIIVFVRRLSSFNIKEDSRKLIILDSPFNGTVAINLWKIPLELMRKNNVQLMVLGYQVPPHLTGLFEVRYSLGETKMNNGINYVGVVKEEVLSRRRESIALEDIIYGKKADEVAFDVKENE